MKTYIANIETSNGTQKIQLAALSIQDAHARVEAQVQSGGPVAARYSVQEQSQGLPPDAASALLNASGALFACLLILVIAVEKLRRYFKG